MAEIPVAVREALDAWLSDLTFGWGVSDAEAEQTKTLCRDAFLAGHQAALDAGARAGEERARAIEECIRAVCRHCRAGAPLTPRGFHSGPEFSVCHAIEMRALLPPAAPERGSGA